MPRRRRRCARPLVTIGIARPVPPNYQSRFSLVANPAARAQVRGEVRLQEKLSARGTALATGPVPTAWQAVADVQDTPLSVSPVVFGVLWIVQLLPSQPSARVVKPEDPTASQAVADVHDTLVSVLPGGLGVFWLVQLLPSQRSTSAVSAPATVGLDEPTATQAVADVHDAPVSVLKGGPGVLWIVQLVPSQRSTSAEFAPPHPPQRLNEPTAMQAVVDAHETAARVA
jgi:hypothetical protein